MTRTPPRPASYSTRPRRELEGATAELRELARGIHPGLLSERGLGAGAEALATGRPSPSS